MVRCVFATPSDHDWNGVEGLGVQLRDIARGREMEREREREQYRERESERKRECGREPGRAERLIRWHTLQPRKHRTIAPSQSAGVVISLLSRKFKHR